MTDGKFARAQWKFILCSMVAYAFFYVTRKNLSMAQPEMLSQALIGIVAAQQATNDAAAMANGFMGIMGYAATTVSGLGIALISKHFGWNAALLSIAVFAFAGMTLFMCAWSAKADGYGRKMQ